MKPTRKEKEYLSIRYVKYYRVDRKSFEETIERYFQGKDKRDMEEFVGQMKCTNDAF